MRAAKLPIKIYTVVINKEYTKPKLRYHLDKLYNYLTAILLEKAVEEVSNDEQLVICLDKSMSANQRKDFKEYVNKKFWSTFKRLKGVKITHEVSYQTPGLQVIDFICGAFGYKYNTVELSKDYNTYTDIIQKRIKLEKNDLFRE